MAYTEQEIITALATPREEWPMYHPQNNTLQQSANYGIIMSYLTGKSTSLQGLQIDADIYSWGMLINLLKDIENITANDQLVLDVFADPALSTYLQQSLNHWLLMQSIHTNKPGAFAAVLQQFRKQGMSTDDIFNYYIANHLFNNNTKKLKIAAPLKDFLLQHIRQSRQLIYPSYGYLSWSNDWSWHYFLLLEEANPAYAAAYALYGMYSERYNPVCDFVEYQNGSYLPGIINFLKDDVNLSPEQVYRKFSAAVKLYEFDPNRFRELVLSLCYTYIKHCLKLRPQWERSIYLKEFEESVNTNLSASTAAIHLLLKHDRDTVLPQLEKWSSGKLFFQISSLMILEYHLGEASFPFIANAITGDSNAKVDFIREGINLLQSKFSAEKYLPLVWEFIKSKSKPVRLFVSGVLAKKDVDAESKAIALLGNKNAEVRQTAALILGHFSSAASKQAIMKMLNTETNDNARDILLQAIADSLPTASSMLIVEETVDAAKKRGKLNKPVDAALDESLLPPLHYTTGQTLSADEVRFLLYRMSRVKEMCSDMEARYILQFLDKTKSGPFGMALIKTFMDKGAKPELKWMMALAALVGDDAVVDKIRITINRWMDENRYKMAEHGVGALALHGSDKALRWVEWYSRKYRTKKANVGTAALQALETAATELGITIHELGDRIVPDFGFEGLFKHFKIDNEEYRAFIDSNFKIAFFNDDNKKLKAIPAAADAALKEEFKAIGKEVRDIVKSQSSRLEYYLIIQRKWTYGNWQKFFLNNPVMFIYATKLLWGVYDEKGNLLSAFTCSEDTSLMDVNSDEISLNDEDTIGIVHPSQMTAESLQQWKQVFYDASIDPVFPQLERKMPALDAYDLSKAIITQFNGIKTKEGSIRSTLEKYGWHKGPTGDGGMLESFNILYFEKKIEAVLEVEGVGAGYGWGLEEKLGRLYIIDKEKVPLKWFAQPSTDADERLVKLKDVPVIFLSEVIAAVESVKVQEG